MGNIYKLIGFSLGIYPSIFHRNFSFVHCVLRWIHGYTIRIGISICSPDAILNYKNATREIFGDSSDFDSGHIQLSFLKISDFYNFIPTQTLMLLAYLLVDYIKKLYTKMAPKNLPPSKHMGVLLFFIIYFFDYGHADTKGN